MTSNNGWNKSGISTTWHWGSAFDYVIERFDNVGGMVHVVQSRNLD